ncbi:MAG: hypothetical protein WDO19_08235 [Bacteroidota bacterium]
MAGSKRSEDLAQWFFAANTENCFFAQQKTGAVKMLKEFKKPTT